MTGCYFNTATHDGKDVLPVRRPLSSSVFLMCAGCRSVSGWRTVERRVASVAVVHDRRRFVPAWLRHLTARDMTEHVR